MYSTLGVAVNSKRKGKLTGTHQKIDRCARWLLNKNVPIAQRKFPSYDEIVHFEGYRGPDGIKRKSPGVDEPSHFILPDNDDGVLIGYINDHYYNLVVALKEKNDVRASFEAAWMAHAIVDGLTPAHHYPYHEVVDELMNYQDIKTIFGKRIKGIMRGDNIAQAARNNWLYWGANGVITKHVAFEYGVAQVITPIPMKRLMPKDVKIDDFKNADYKKSFYGSLEKIAGLKMYDRFLKKGWTTELAIETSEILIPEIIRAVALAWADALQEANKRGKK